MKSNSTLEVAYFLSVEGKKSKIRKIVINGIKSTRPNEIANEFCNYFSTVVSTLKQTSYPLIDFTWRKPLNPPLCTYKTIHFGYVSVIEVIQLLKKLKRKKAVGNDDLPPGLLKDSVAVISAPLTPIINLSFRSGVFLSDWKIAKILSLYKKVLPINLDITTQYQIYPLFPRLLKKSYIIGWSIIYLRANLLERQFGFRARRSTELAVTFLCDNIHTRKVTIKIKYIRDKKCRV